ncbi:MAG TPA: hypothetical protein VHG72_19275 [Polyangia bacterium]|nr:hypothetical protein [Polyangia bacterium]
MAPDGGAGASASRSPLDEANARFGAAVVAHDAAGVLAWFSKTRPFTFVSGGPDGHTRKLRFDYAAVSKGIQPHGNFRDFFFGDDSELLDAFEKSQNWSRVRGNLFVPPGNEARPEDAPTAVRWRKEGNVWVIDQLFDEGA